MTQIELDEIIASLCKRAGLIKNIKLNKAAKIGSRIGSEWEFDWRQTGQEGLLLTIRYWHNSTNPESEAIFIPWQAIKSDNMFQDIVDGIIEKIDFIKSKIDR